MSTGGSTGAAGLVSVIIPTFNRAYCIEATVDSVLAQTYPAVEVVVVDDGSVDDIADVMARRYRGDPRVTFIQRANGGIGAARNTGLRAATGAYIAFVDSDDIWLPWKLEAQLACLRHFGVGAAFSDISSIDARGSVTRERALFALYHAWLQYRLDELFERSEALGVIAPGVGPADARVHAGDVYTASVVGNLISTSTLVLTRERFEQVGQYDESLLGAGEDYEYHIRVCRHGPVAFLDVPTTLYRYGESDQATRRTLHLAQHYVEVLEAELQRHRDLIRLSTAEVDRILANAHSWVGNELLAAGRGPEAVVHFRRAMALGRRDMETGLRYLLAVLPTRIRSGMLGFYRAFKRWHPGRMPGRA